MQLILSNLILMKYHYKQNESMITTINIIKSMVKKIYLYFIIIQCIHISKRYILIFLIQNFIFILINLKNSHLFLFIIQNYRKNLQIYY